METYKTNTIHVPAGDVRIRTIIRGSTGISSNYTCEHNHPAGYGVGHDVFYTSLSKKDLVAFCDEVSAKTDFTLSVI